MWTCLLLERGRLCIGLGQRWGSRRPRFRAGSEYSGWRELGNQIASKEYGKSGS